MLKTPMATIAMLLPVILPLSVVSMLVWGPLYENAVGCAMLPAMIAILIERIDHLCSACSSRLQDGVVILLVFLCAGFCHPNTCFILGIFALPYALKKTHSLKMRLIILICAVSLWTFLFCSPFFKRTVNCNDRIHKGKQYGEMLFNALHLDYSSISSNEFFVLLLFAVMLGVVVLVSSKLERKCSCGRYFFGLGFVAIMATMTLFPNTSTARFLTGFWYVDTIRFVFIFQCLVSPFIVAVITNLKIGLTLCKVVKFTVTSSFLVLTFAQLGYYAKHLDINRINYESNIEVTFSEEDLEIFSSIHEIVGNDVVINGFYDSSLWSYALCGVNATVKANVPNHLAATDVHLEEIMKNLSDLGNDEAYFEALRNTCKNLNYHYVLQVENESKMKLGIDDMGRWYLEDLGPNSVVEEGTKGFTKCGTWESPSGKMTLYRIEFD